MLTFLRKTRKSLIDSLPAGKASGGARKYMLYAIGEIALVVIGILIALQINNWNQGQKELEYEHKILSEIYNSLQSDSARFEMHFEPRINQRKKGIDSLLSFIHFDKKVPDTTILKHYRRLYSSPQITVNFGPYETLKLNGLEKIKNDEIRFWLVDLFESFLPRQIFFVTEEISRHESKIIALDEEFFLRNRTEMSTRGELYVTGKLSSNNILEDSRFLYFIELHDNINQEQIFRIGRMKKAIQITLEKLRSHLNSSEVYPEVGKKKQGVTDVL